MSRQGRGMSAGLCCGGQRGAGERAERVGDPWPLPLLDPHVSQSHPPAPSSRVQDLQPFPRLVRVVWPSCVQQGEALPRVSAHCEFIHGPGGLCVLGALWAGGSRG